MYAHLCGGRVIVESSDSDVCGHAPGGPSATLNDFATEVNVIGGHDRRDGSCNVEDGSSLSLLKRRDPRAIEVAA